MLSGSPSIFTSKDNLLHLLLLLLLLLLFLLLLLLLLLPLNEAKEEPVKRDDTLVAPVRGCSRSA